MPMHDGMFGAPLVMIILWVLLIVPPFWKIFSKAGFSGWLSLLMLVPLANLITLWLVAFMDWPALRDAAQPETGGTGD